MAVPPSLQNLPESLKHLKHYLKIAEDHDKKDKIVSYYCRFFVMQKAIKSSMNAESRSYLHLLMDYMEKFKLETPEEAIHNEIVGQATVEDYALKVFLYADNEDRAGRFNRAMIKSFFTAGLLFDVLTVFGVLSEQLEANQKYSKWKATYIHKCLQSGETPMSGPIGGDPEDEYTSQPIGFENTVQPSNLQPPSQPSGSSNAGGYGLVAPPTTPHTPSPQSERGPSPQVTVSDTWTPQPAAGGVQLTAVQFSTAIKSCNFAVSALRYEDVNTAVDYLQKTLKLLTTGQE